MRTIRTDSLDLQFDEPFAKELARAKGILKETLSYGCSTITAGARVSLLEATGMREIQLLKR